MQIDLNKNELTLSNVAKLIASKDDSKNRQIRVTKSGIVFLSDIVGGQNTEDLLFRFETFSWGTDYVGVNAAKDAKWVERIYNALKTNWPNPTNDYLDYY